LFGYGVTGYRFVDAQFPRVLTETGIIGLLAFLYLLYCTGKVALENLRVLKDPLFRGIVIGFLAGYTGLLFHSVGANTFIIVRIMEPFWFIAGLVVVLPVVERQSKAEAVDATAAAADPISAVGPLSRSDRADGLTV
jgi:O-antigen ligase